MHTFLYYDFYTPLISIRLAVAVTFLVSFIWLLYTDLTSLDHFRLCDKNGNRYNRTSKNIKDALCFNFHPFGKTFPPVTKKSCCSRLKVPLELCYYRFQYSNRFPELVFVEAFRMRVQPLKMYLYDN